jgi:hypothetical protein
MTKEDQMLNKTSTLIAACMAAVLTLGALAAAQTTPAKERFTFMAANGSKAGASGEGRLELVVERWSDQTDRERLVSALKDKGEDGVAVGIHDAFAVGYMRWPGNLGYTLRYAHRIPRPDGGEDFVLATDAPISLWWDSEGSTPSTGPQFTVIQLRLNKDGRGEGKLSLGAKLATNDEHKTIVLGDYEKQPVVLTDVQRERVTS